MFGTPITQCALQSSHIPWTYISESKNRWELFNILKRKSDFDSGVKRLRRYARIVQRLGYVVRLSEVRLVTASAVHKLSGRINVKSLSRIPDFQYNPELFPAAMLRRQGIHFTCHLGGSVLITGIKHSTDLDNVVFPTMVEIELLVV